MIREKFENLQICTNVNVTLSVFLYSLDPSGTNGNLLKLLSVSTFVLLTNPMTSLRPLSLASKSDDPQTATSQFDFPKLDKSVPS